MRDHNRCFRCNSNRDLEVHHIISRRHLNLKYDPDNVILLCHNCHQLITFYPAYRIPFYSYLWKIKGNTMEELERRKNIVKQWTVSELEEHIKKLEQMIRDLQNQSE